LSSAQRHETSCRSGFPADPRIERQIDVDVAIAIGSWQEFERLASRLERRRSHQHTFLVLGHEVDVVPYGRIEAVDQTIMWPNDYRMNVLGLQEAFDSAEVASLPGNVLVRVPSVAAQAVLKLMAWRDRHDVDRRDAIDLGTIINWYSEDPFVDELYEDSADLLAAHHWDTALAGAERLGRHMAGLISGDSLQTLRATVEDDAILERLARDVGGSFAYDLERVSALRSGLNGAK
jgi:predicted nucleotidyltransferase